MMKRRGRPPLKPHLRRRNGINVRFRDDTFKALKAAARANGQTMSAQAEFYVEAAMRRRAAR